MALLPSNCLRVTRVKVGEKGSIRKVPQSGAIIGHCVGGARKIVVARDVAIVSLMQRLKAKQIGRWAGRSSRPFSLPEHRSGVVMEVLRSLLADIGGMGKDIVVKKGARQFQITVIDGASEIGRRDKHRGDGVCKLGPPEDWFRQEMYSAHTHT